tara:strand:- start:68 stop:1810 length:1743 start_codon:yes stop_codon:yes gene_type:complete
MKNSVIIFIMILGSHNSFCQWNSFYPQDKIKKKSTSKDQEKERLKYHAHFFSAIKHKALEDYDIAEKELKSCIEINEKEAGAFYEIALIYKYKKELELAETYIKKALKIDAKNKWYIVLYAEILMQKKDFKNAVFQYKKLIEIENENQEFYYAIAEAYIYDNNFIKAIYTYDLLEQKVGVSKPISLQKYKLYMQSFKKEKAKKELLSILDRSPKDIEVLELLSELYLLNNEKEKAFDVFKKIADIDPENGRVHLTLADYYRQSGNNSKSFEELMLAFKSPKLGVEIKSQILVSYLQIINLNDSILDQAFILSKLLIKAHPNSYEPYLIYADLLYSDKKYNMAKDQYIIVLEKNKKIKQVWSQLLFIYAEEDNFSEILVLSQEALNYFSTDPLIYYFNGIANRKYRNNKEAVFALEMGLEFVFENDALLLEFYSALGDLYFTLKEYKKSDDYYEKALDIDSENLIVLNNYSYYLSLRKENLEKAQQMSLLCNSKDQNNSTYQDTYAWILYQMQDFKNAKIWIDKAIENGGSESPVIIEHRGDIIYMLGDVEKAVREWIRASKMGEGSELLNKKIQDRKLHD